MFFQVPWHFVPVRFVILVVYPRAENFVKVNRPRHSVIALELGMVQPVKVPCAELALALVGENGGGGGYFAHRASLAHRSHRARRGRRGPQSARCWHESCAERSEKKQKLVAIWHSYFLRSLASALARGTHLAYKKCIGCVFISNGGSHAQL